MTTTTLDSAKTNLVSSLTKNQIALQRGFVCQMSGENTINSSSVPELLKRQEKLSIQAELMQFGFILSEDALNVVTVEWFNDVMSYLKKSLGIGDYRPFYKNFPSEVMELSHTELFLNAIIHYWSNGTWEVSSELQDRGIKFENIKFTPINLGSEKDFLNIFTNLVSMNQSITENDKKVVEWFVINYGEKIVIPKNIPFKETLCILASYGLKVPVTSPTDVLRIATYFSGGDISLPAIPKVTIKDIRSNRKKIFYENLKNSQIEAREKFKFKNLSRVRRKYLLTLLENCNFDLGEMKHKIGRWLRLGEILHVGEYRDRFPKSFEAFNELRNHTNYIVTFESIVDKSFIGADNDNLILENALQVLSKKPSIFARKLDFLLRNYNNTIVLAAFEKIALKVSRKVLWELYNHFLNRDVVKPRLITLKGKKSNKVKLKELPAMNIDVINQVKNTILNCISIHFSQLEDLGNVWIDEKLKKLPLPTSIRSINTSIKTYVRGTRISFNENAKVIRPYIHWFDENGWQDLDLSATFYNENLENIDHLSFTNLKLDKYNSCHSGDVRHRQGACAEYVDIDIEKCLSNGIRYIMVQVHNFENRPMHTLKDCVFGLMEREFPESNPIFVPKTISNAVSISNESSTVCITFLDLKEKEYIWIDTEVQSKGLATIEDTLSTTNQLIKGTLDKNTLSVHDLLTIHAMKRGVIVDSIEDADTIFNYDDYVSSYEKIANLM